MVFTLRLFLAALLPGMLFDWRDVFDTFWRKIMLTDRLFDPWRVVRWMSADLVVAWLLTIAASSHIGGFGPLPFVVVGPLYLMACIAAISVVAAFQVWRGCTRLRAQGWLIVAAVAPQALFVADIWNDYALPVDIGNLVFSIALLSAPGAALVYLAFAGRR